MQKFKVEIMDVESFSDGSYYQPRIIAFGKSPKEAWERTRTSRKCQFKDGHPEGYGGTTVLQCRKMWRGSKLVMCVWD